MNHYFFTLVLYVLLCVAMGYIGRDKKFRFWGNFFVSLLLTPIVGVVCFFAQTDKVSTEAKAS